MGERNPPQDLWEELNRFQEEYRESPERLGKHYLEGESDFNRPPHEILRHKAESFISEGLDYEGRPTVYPKEPAPLPIHFWHVFTAIGTEVLLKALTLEDDPEWYIEKIPSGREWSSFGKYKCKMGLLSEELTGS